MIFFTFDTQEDETKFYRLYKKYHKLLYKTAYDILRNPQDAEDAMQTSLEIIYRYFDRIKNEPDKKCIGYMVVIIRNSALKVYNKRKKTVSLEEEHYVFSEAAVSAEAEMKYWKKYDLIEALKSMDTKYRDVLFLKYIYGYSVKEIADMLDISESNVTTRLNRGRGYAKNTIRKGDKGHGRGL